jgi:hypothetical protein
MEKLGHQQFLYAKVSIFNLQTTEIKLFSVYNNEHELSKIIRICH